MQDLTNIKARFFVARLQAGSNVQLRINTSASRVLVLPVTEKLAWSVELTFKNLTAMHVDDWVLSGPVAYAGERFEIVVQWHAVYFMTDGERHCADWSIIPPELADEYEVGELRAEYARLNTSATWVTKDISVGGQIDFGAPKPKLPQRALSREADARARRAKFRVIQGGR